MPIRRWHAIVATMVAACSSGSPAPAAPTGPPIFTWPVADGWRREAFDFPLEFAPELPHTGTEELRFAPGFFEREAPGYWTYAFAWVLTDDAPLDEATLARELTAYFRGLAAAVLAEKPDDIRPSLDLIEVELGLPRSERGTTFAVSGTIVMFDVFATPLRVEGPLDLEVELDVRPCGRGRAVLLIASPRRRPDPIRDALDEVAASFRCGG